MHDAFSPTLFNRHGQPFRALLIDDQAWFSLSDLAALLGRWHTPERIAKALAEDQLRSEWLMTPFGLKEVRLVDESGLYATLVRDGHPENEALRAWVARRVIPELRNSERSDAGAPRFGTLQWKASGLQVIHWQDRLWVALEDLPQVVPGDVLRAGVARGASL
ncbi:hypothetical protein BZL41_00500 [Pseudomonas sp. PIC25]|uniref:BRO-N domain-containing protein n=1 Tax=Pseudomonas sp. PIC25 TaxID=1958773 RepID=UPI000BDC6424|nr:BRO family protein [Pseudomonas sp. PIC25]PAU66663.1 hypothetical protein BZL41_00500 [Pseudomonas sp. PIC25]